MEGLAVVVESAVVAVVVDGSGAEVVVAVVAGAAVLAAADVVEAVGLEHAAVAVRRIAKSILRIV